MFGWFKKKPAPKTSPEREGADTRLLGPGEGTRTTLPVQCGKWHVQGDRFFRVYEFSGLPPPVTSASIKLLCALSTYANGYISKYFRFFLRPYLYLQPSRVPFEAHYVPAPFFVGLTGEGAGTEASPLFLGGVFNVSACSVEEDADTVMLDVG